MIHSLSFLKPFLQKIIDVIFETKTNHGVPRRHENYHFFVVTHTWPISWFWGAHACFFLFSQTLLFGFLFPSHFSLAVFYSDGHFLSFNLFVQKSFKLSKQTKNQNIGKPFNFAMPREHGLEGRVAGFSGTGSSGSGARLSGSAWRGRRLIALRSGPQDRLL